MHMRDNTQGRSYSRFSGYTLLHNVAHAAAPCLSQQLSAHA